MPLIKRHNAFIKVMLSICVAQLVLLIQSCDPARILMVKSSGKPNASVTIYSNADLRTPANAEGQENGQVVIKIPTNEKPGKWDKAFYLGFGGWGDNESVAYFSRTIDSIIISNHDSKVVLNTQEEINAYLLKHRRGLFEAGFDDRSKLTV